MSRAQKAQKTVSGKTFYKKINIYHTIAVWWKNIFTRKVLYRHVKMRLLRPRIFTGEFSWCLNMWIYSCLCGSSLFGFLGSLGGDIMGPYPRLRDPKALKPSAFRMISWAKSRFFCVISYRGQDDVHRFYYVRMYSWSTCFKCVWWHVRPRGGPHEPRMDIDVLLTYAIPLVKKNLKNNAR